MHAQTQCCNRRIPVVACLFMKEMCAAQIFTIVSILQAKHSPIRNSSRSCGLWIDLQQSFFMKSTTFFRSVAKRERPLFRPQTLQRTDNLHLAVAMYHNLARICSFKFPILYEWGRCVFCWVPELGTESSSRGPCHDISASENEMIATAVGPLKCVRAVASNIDLHQRSPATHASVATVTTAPF